MDLHYSGLGVVVGVLTTIVVVAIALLLSSVAAVLVVLTKIEGRPPWAERLKECGRNSVLVLSVAHAHAGYPYNAECASTDQRVTAKVQWKLLSSSIALGMRILVGCLAICMWISAAMALPTLVPGYEAREWATWMLIFGLVVFAIHIVAIAVLVSLVLMLAIPQCPARLSIQKYRGALPTSLTAQALSHIFQWGVSFPIVSLTVDATLFAFAFVTAWGAGTWSANTSDAYVVAVVFQYVILVALGALVLVDVAKMVKFVDVIVSEKAVSDGLGFSKHKMPNIKGFVRVYIACMSCGASDKEKSSTAAVPPKKGVASSDVAQAEEGAAAALPPLPPKPHHARPALPRYASTRATAANVDLRTARSAFEDVAGTSASATSTEGDTDDAATSPRVRALFDFEAAEEDELDLTRGDTITMISRADAEWWRGCVIAIRPRAAASALPHTPLRRPPSPVPVPPVRPLRAARAPARVVFSRQRTWQRLRSTTRNCLRSSSRPRTWWTRGMTSSTDARGGKSGKRAWEKVRTERNSSKTTHLLALSSAPWCPPSVQAWRSVRCARAKSGLPPTPPHIVGACVRAVAPMLAPPLSTRGACARSFGGGV